MVRTRYPGTAPAALPADRNGNTRQRHILGNAPATRNIQPTATTNYYEATPNPAISHVPHDKPTQHPYRSGRRTARHRRGRIILFHAREHFNLYWSALDLPRAGFGSWEQPVADMLGFLLSGKMYAIFALLFGLSFFIQSDNQAQRGNDFSLRFAWRMVLLFGIGLVNAAIYNGDVLTYYAFSGC